MKNPAIFACATSNLIIASIKRPELAYKFTDDEDVREKVGTWRLPFPSQSHDGYRLLELKMSTFSNVASG